MSEENCGNLDVSAPPQAEKVLERDRCLKAGGKEGLPKVDISPSLPASFLALPQGACPRIDISNMESEENTHPTISEFILFCAGHCGREWLPLYDEMCRVAGRRFFKDLGYADLRGLGLFLGLTEVHRTAEMVMRSLAQNPEPVS